MLARAKRATWAFMCSSVAPTRRRRIRSRMFLAASVVKVTIRMSSMLGRSLGLASLLSPVSISWITRSTKTAVFPLPAEAETKMSFCRSLIAGSCSLLGVKTIFPYSSSCSNFASTSASVSSISL